MIVQRDFYLDKLISRKNNGLVKIVTGIRRCGKSFLLMELFRGHLIEEGVPENHIISIALDETENEELRDARKLHEAIVSRIGDDEDYYVLIDEAQMAITDEERKNPDAYIALYGVLNSLLHRNNVDVYITGSNSKFLSEDIRTEFRGRGDEIHIAPFSFREYLQSVDSDKTDKHEAFAEYLMFGGMPGLLQKNTPEDKIQYLKGLFDETYFKDIIERHKIERPDVLSELTDCLCSSVGSITNINKLKDSVNSIKKSKKGNSVSYETLSSYMKYLKDCFLFSEVKRYDIRGKQYFASLNKYYCADHGLRNARLNMRQIEETHLMENIIYNHLVNLGYSVDVGIVERKERGPEGKLQNTTYEIDFVVNRGMYQYYIQSAFSVENEEKRNAELKPFSIVNNSFRKIVVTRYGMRPWFDDDGIFHVSIIDFLLRDDILV